MSTPKTRDFPCWFKMICCGIPLSALLAVSVGLAWGVSVSPVVTFTLAALAWRVIAKVLGIEQQLVSINLPPWPKRRAITAEPKTE